MRLLVAHVVGGHLYRVARVVRSFCRRGPYLSDVVLGRRSGRLRRHDETADAQRQCFRRADALDAVVSHQAGSVTGAEFLAMRGFDVTVHTWDLARATGGDEQADEGLAACTLRRSPVSSAALDSRIVATGDSADEDPEALEVARLQRTSSVTPAQRTAKTRNRRSWMRVASVALGYSAPRRAAAARRSGVKRVSVVGNSGAGKTTLSARLAAALGVPHVELDADLPPARLDRAARRRVPTARRRGVGTATSAGWSTATTGGVRDSCGRLPTRSVWLDLPKATVMRRLIWRTVRRAVTREELWNGNREPSAACSG